MDSNFLFKCRLREIVDQGEEDLDEDEMYMRRLAGGLFSLQLVITFVHPDMFYNLSFFVINNIIAFQRS